MRYLLVLPLAVALVTAQTEPELALSVGHAGAPDRAVFLGTDLATSSWSNVALIDVRTGIVVAHLPQGSLVTALEPSPRGEVLAVATCSDGVNLWDVKARRLIGRVAEGRECPDGLAFNSDGTLLAVANYQCCSTRHGLEVWDVRSRTL